jgi:hypothetical protein
MTHCRLDGRPPSAERVGDLLIEQKIIMVVREKGVAGKELILFDRYPDRERIPDVAGQVILITETSQNRAN